MPTILDTYVRLHPGSAKLYEESSRVFPSGVTHDIRYLTPFPIFVESAAGSHKWDVDGNEYHRLRDGPRRALHGPRPPGDHAAIVEQAAKGTHYGANHRLEIEWGKLVQGAGPLRRGGALHQLRHRGDADGDPPRPRLHRPRPSILKFDQPLPRLARRRRRHSRRLRTRTRTPPASRPPRSRTRSASPRATSRSSRRSSRPATSPPSSSSRPAPPGARCRCTRRSSPSCARSRSKHNTVLIFDEVVTGFRVSPGGDAGTLRRHAGPDDAGQDPGRRHARRRRLRHAPTSSR